MILCGPRDYDACMNLDTTGTFQNRNARIVHIRKFVCDPPKGAHTLRLVTIEEPPMLLGQWLEETCRDNASIPEDVDGRLREHGEEISGPVGATLSWSDANGVNLGSKRLNWKPVDVSLDPSEQARNEALGINGTELGREVQRQRHYEAMIRSYFAAHQAQIAQTNANHRETVGQQMDMIRLLGGLLTDSYRTNHDAQIQLDKLRMEQRSQLDRASERVQEMAEKLRLENPTDPEATVKAEFMKDAGKMVIELVPFFMEKLAERFLGGVDEGGAPANNNGAPAQKAAAPSAAAGGE